MMEGTIHRAALQQPHEEMYLCHCAESDLSCLWSQVVTVPKDPQSVLHMSNNG